MKGIKLHFKNRQNNDGSLSSFWVDDCLVAQNGGPVSARPQIIIHLPKSNQKEVDGAWVEWGGADYHIIGVTVQGIEDNTPTRWDRYAIAERVY